MATPNTTPSKATPVSITAQVLAKVAAKASKVVAARTSKHTSACAAMATQLANVPNCMLVATTAKVTAVVINGYKVGVIANGQCQAASKHGSNTVYVNLTQAQFVAWVNAQATQANG